MVQCQQYASLQQSDLIESRRHQLRAHQRGWREPEYRFRFKADVLINMKRIIVLGGHDRERETKRPKSCARWVARAQQLPRASWSALWLASASDRNQSCGPL